MATESSSPASSSSSSSSRSNRFLPTPLTRTFEGFFKRRMLARFWGSFFVVIFILFLLLEFYPLGVKVPRRNPIGSYTVVPPKSQENDYYLNLLEDSVAICLDGSAEFFDLTGPTMLNHLVDAYSNSAVFLTARLDHYSHKLTIFSKLRNIASIHIAPEFPILDDGPPKSVYSVLTPEALQIILQEARLVENCLTLIEKHERKFGMKFKWIMRTRLDTFWANKPPALHGLDPKKYTAPAGSIFSGVNDRMGIGGKKVSTAALRRLTSLGNLRDMRLMSGNAETTLQYQLVTNKIEIHLLNVSFCVLSKKEYNWPLFPQSVPVVSISSKGYLNGAKCRPCEPAAVGDTAREELIHLATNWGSVGNVVDVDLCDPRGPWQVGWKKIYANVVGTKSAEISRSVIRRTITNCLSENQALQFAAATYHGPPPVIICLLAKLRDSVAVGENHALWYTFLKSLESSSVVYSVGVDNDNSWESQLIEKIGPTIHLFDATPSGVPKLILHRDKVLRQFRLHNWCIGPVDGKMQFNAMMKWGDTSLLFTTLPFSSSSFEFINQTRMLPVKRLQSSMCELGHSRIDLLKINAGGTEFSIILEDWALMHEPLPVCQLLIRFPEKEAGDRGEFLRSRSVDVLNTLGLFLIRCWGDPESPKCLFLSAHFCM